MLECKPKFVAINEEADHHIVHRRFGKTYGVAYKALDPGL